MNFFKSLVIVIYLCIYLLIGGLLIYMTTDYFPFERLGSYINYINSNANVRWAIAGIGLFFILMGIISTRINFGRLQREKTIAFDNADGQIVISLAAIEDYIKKLVKSIPQVKELKAAVTAGKKGICVVTRAAIYSDSNIPEVTENIQSIIKARIQGMLGIEEQINVKIHVGKLVSRNPKDDEIAEADTSRHVPFGGLE